MSFYSRLRRYKYIHKTYYLLSTSSHMNETSTLSPKTIGIINNSALS